MRTSLATAGAILVVALVVAACDHGAAMLVENQTDQDYVVRVSGNTFTDDAQWVDGEVVTIAPANSKRVVYLIPFTGGLVPRQLDILRPDCLPIFSQPFDQIKGTYIVIDDNAAVSIRNEFPQNGDPASPADDCRTMPTPSPR